MLKLLRENIGIYFKTWVVILGLLGLTYIPSALRGEVYWYHFPGGLFLSLMLGWMIGGVVILVKREKQTKC